jgi:hypothetical protein
MANPFRLRWLDGWTFQTVLMEGAVQVEARGFGICIRTTVQPGETPRTAADRLVLEEDRRRRSLHNAWLRGQAMPKNADLGTLPGASLDLPSPEAPVSPGAELSEQEIGADGPNPSVGAAPEASNVVRQLDSQLSRSVN